MRQNDVATSGRSSSDRDCSRNGHPLTVIDTNGLRALDSQSLPLAYLSVPFFSLRTDPCGLHFVPARIPIDAEYEIVCIGSRDRVVCAVWLLTVPTSDLLDIVFDRAASLAAHPGRSRCRPTGDFLS